MAIDGDVGLVGFQLYYKMPKVDEMIDFLAKIYLKFKDLPTDDTAKPYSKGKWIVFPSNQATNPRTINEMLKKIGYRGIILANENMNQKLNSARGIWPYLAHIWESQPSDEFHHKAIDETTKQVIQLKDRIIQCIIDMNNHNLKGIASCFNNDSILKCLGPIILLLKSGD